MHACEKDTEINRSDQNIELIANSPSYSNSVKLGMFCGNQ